MRYSTKNSFLPSIVQQFKKQTSVKTETYKLYSRVF